VDTVCRNLGVGTFPTAICYNRADGKVYTADNFDGRVSIIDVFGDTLLNALGAGSSPGALVWNSANDRIYCGDDYAGLVTSIDGRTNGLHGSIVVAGAVWGLAVDSAANKVYCTNYLDDKVTVLDGVTETIVATVSVGAGPRSICHNEADGRTYAGAREGNSLAVIRDSTTGVAEGRAPAVNATSGPTLFSGALNDGLSGFGVVYDVQGRRTVAARPGVYFVREQARVRKAVVAR
jgi:YVTN family beta-propeller protein